MISDRLCVLYAARSSRWRECADYGTQGPRTLTPYVFSAPREGSSKCGAAPFIPGTRLNLIAPLKDAVSAALRKAFDRCFRRNRRSSTSSRATGPHAGSTSAAPEQEKSHDRYLLSAKNVKKYSSRHQSFAQSIAGGGRKSDQGDRGISSISEGEIFGLIGESGSGKTRPAKLVMKLSSPRAARYSSTERSDATSARKSSRSNAARSR